MPLTRVSLLKGKPPEYRQAILDGLYQAMREAFDVPEDDRFMTIDEYDKSNFLYGENYLGIARDDDLVIVQITVNKCGRTSAISRYALHDDCQHVATARIHLDRAAASGRDGPPRCARGIAMAAPARHRDSAVADRGTAAPRLD